MSKSSRDKGKRGELEISKELERHGLPYIREQDGRTQGADFLIDRRFMAEVKRREKFSLLEAHRHVEGMADKHLTPVVFWRPSHQPWRASCLLSDWLDLIKEAGA